MGKKSNEIDMSKDSKQNGGELAKDLLKILAVGTIGGLATIAGAKKFGEKIDENKRK